jgi:O-antigen biosynthesis protein WbqP
MQRFQRDAGRRRALKRIGDVLLGLLLLCFLSIPMIFIALFVKLTSKGPALYWSDRVGVNNEIFKMPKFRTMRTGTPAVATHLLKNPGAYLTPLGYYLRKFSLDELPQLWSIFKGDMSFVGPRPALYNQDDLIALRTSKGIHQIIPGITGWAQINGRDDIPIPQKVEYDEYYFRKRSFLFDLKILYRTAVKVIKAEGVRH